MYWGCVREPCVRWVKTGLSFFLIFCNFLSFSLIFPDHPTLLQNPCHFWHSHTRIWLLQSGWKMQQQFKHIIKNLRGQPPVWDLDPEICWIHKWIYFVVPTLAAAWRLPCSGWPMEHRECNSEYFLGLNDSTNEFVGEKEWFPSTIDINTDISHLIFVCIRGMCGFVYKQRGDRKLKIIWIHGKYSDTTDSISVLCLADRVL